MFIVLLEACVDNYVVTCNPAPKTPASEVIVKTVTDLATTGGEANIAGIVIAGCFVVAGGLLFLYNHFTRKERRDDWEYGTEYEVSSTESVFEAAESEGDAREMVAASPYDTGLVRRLKGSDFWLPFD